MKRVTFYYVRHGQTEFNRDQVIQGGGVDSPLAPEGIPVVEATAKALAPVDFAACWASPLGRVQQTAKILMDARGEGRRLRIRTLDNLREVDFGTLDGKPYKGYKNKYMRCFLKQDFSAYGGERGADVRKRVRKAFAKMYKEARDGDKVLVVAHGALLRYVLLELSQASGASKSLLSRSLRARNASVSIITCEDGSFNFTHMPMDADEVARYVEADREIEGLAGGR